MLHQNKMEYELVREELLKLKECITSYMGFVIGGSGVAFFGIATISRNPESYAILGFACTLLSIIVSLVLYILFYKFNSHNRAAGYCKLLNQEHIEVSENVANEDQFFSWEICVDILRESDFKKSVVLNKCKKVKIDDEDIDIYEKVEKLYQERYFFKKLIKGIQILFKTVIGKIKTRSWYFPLYVTAVFFTINVVFLSIGSIFIFKTSLTSEISTMHMIYFILIVIFQVYVWSNYLGKLYELSDGGSTIDAFCWKFLPVRLSYIERYDKESEYSLRTFK